MGNFAGWLAALGGVIAIAGNYVDSLEKVYPIEIGGALAIIFGIWAALK